MNKTIKINLILIIMAVALMVLSTSSNAASAKINANNEVEIGAPINISVTGSGVQWDLKLLVNGQEIARSSELDNYENNKSINFSKSYTPTNIGELKIELKGSVTEYTDGSTITSFTSKTVNVKPKTTTQNPSGNTGNNQGGNTGNNGGTTNKPTVTEPKFTSTSKTVYAKSDVNLRSSWSTQSNAVKVEKGTELRLTGTSTEKVNGYTWYRVTYNGQIKYVVKDYITETKPEEEKSNNADLKALNIEGVTLEPAFSKDVLQYTAKLSEYDKKEIKVTAEAQEAKSVVKVEGNTNISLGENVITVAVTAEDGTVKTYKIILQNEKKTQLGLQSLKIKDIELKEFSTDKYQYEIDFKDLDKLEIEAIANTEGSTVEILGNENLKEGENCITIIVSSADEKEKVTYQIVANKEKKAATKEADQKLDMKKILIYAVIALIVLTLIIVLIVKYIKNNSESNMDYMYKDNLKEEEKVQTSEDEKSEIKNVEENKEEDSNKQNTEKDENYNDETQTRRNKGKHSK